MGQQESQPGDGPLLRQDLFNMEDLAISFSAVFHLEAAFGKPAHDIAGELGGDSFQLLRLNACQSMRETYFHHALLFLFQPLQQLPALEAGVCV